VVVVLPLFVSLTPTHPLGNVRLPPILSLILLGEARDRSDSDVLADKVVGGEVIEDVAILDAVSALAFLGLSVEGIELLDHDLRHALKDLHNVISILFEGRVIYQGSELVEDLLGPASDLVIDNVDPLEPIREQFHLLRLVYQSSVHFNDFVVHGGTPHSSAAGLRSDVLARVGARVDGELVEPVPELLVVLLQLVDLPLAVRHCHQQLRVSLLPSQKLPHHLLDVCDPCGCLDGFEGLIYGSRLPHFLLHLLPHERVPQLLDIEALPHLKF